MPSLKRLLGKSAVASAANLCVMVGLFVRDAYVASVFGRSDAVDAYFLALMVPLMAVQLLGSGLQSSVVPAYTRVIALGDPLRKRRFVESLTLATLVVSVLIAFLSWALGSAGLALLGRADRAAASELTRQLLQVLLSITILEGVSSLWAALLQAEDCVVEPILSRIAVPLGGALGMVLVAGTWGIRALAWGTLAGYFVQLIWRGSSLLRAGMSVVPRLHAASDELRSVARQYFPVMLAGGIGAMTNVVDNSMAALCSQPAAVSALNYGSRVSTVLTTAGSVAVSAAVLPYLSKLTARGSYEELGRTIRVFVTTILLVGVPAAALIFVFSEELVRLVFERGQFSAGDTALVSGVQAMFALQIPVLVVGVFMARVISAFGRNDVLLYITMGSVVSNALLNYVLMQFLGVLGIALATSVVYLLSAICASAAAFTLLGEQRRVASR
jgi:putative peptidoglycan lipid II flippase